MLRIFVNLGKFFASFVIVVGVASAIWMIVAPEDARDTIFAMVTTAGSATTPVVAHTRPPMADRRTIVEPRLIAEMPSDAEKRRISLRLPFGGFELQWEVDRR
jgi:hypothetical protein